jgi:hypothetical protein
VGGAVVDNRVDQPAGRTDSIGLRKRLNSWCRCQAIYRPINVPSGTFAVSLR